MLAASKQYALIVRVLYALILLPIAICQYEEVVQTVAQIQDPVGVEYGLFNGQSGLFVSSFALHDVFFYSYDQLNRYTPNHHFTPAKIVSGGGLDTDIDGSFEVASFGDPSRMSFDLDSNILYVASRLSMRIRAVHFGSKTVSTISSDAGEPLEFSIYGVAQFSDFPGLDVQLSNPDLLFVASSKMVSRVDKTDDFVWRKTDYASLNEYLMYKEYPYSTSNIYSIAPDNRNKILYIAVSEARNVILSVPFERTNQLEPSYIKILAGLEDHTWGGIGTSFPAIVSGKASETVLGMPMHLQYDATGNNLLWSEGVPVMDGIMTGSLMLRELDLGDPDRTTSILAGVNAFTASPIEISPYMGSTGDYVDGLASEAAFKYPISIVYVRSTNANGKLSPELYVADRWNNAIRRVSREVYTPAPSITMHPTRSPSISQYPTRWPTRNPTAPPVTHRPTMRPSFSRSPTYQFKPTLYPTEPNPPTLRPTARPTHIHAISFPTRHPSHAPTAPLPVEIRYEDHSAFGGLGFGKDGVSGLDIFLATLLGLLLAALIIMFLVMKERAEKRRQRRKKKMVLRLDEDDDSDDSDEDMFEDMTSPTGDVRPRPTGLWRSLVHHVSAAAGYAAASARELTFSDRDIDTSSVHSDAHLMGHNSTSSTSEKPKVGISRFFSKARPDYESSGDSMGSVSISKSSPSVSSMLQKLKIGKPSLQNVVDNSLAGVEDRSLSSVNNTAPGQSQGRGRDSGGRSATGIAEGSVTRGGGSRRSLGPDYL